MDKPFPAYQGDQPYVFVSYAHEDAAAVYPQLVWLREQGINVWYDEGISPGTRWSEELASALKQASLLLYFGTPESVSSRHCLDEVNFALDGGTPTVAVHLVQTELTPGLQLRLSSHQAIFKHQLSEAAYREKLLNAVTAHLSGEMSPEIRQVTTAAKPASDETSRLPLFAGLGTVVVLLVAALFWWTESNVTEPKSVPEAADRSVQPSEPVAVNTPVDEDGRPSIAVLPFENFSPDAANAYFASGIHDDILSALSKLKGIRVISRTSVMRFAETDKGLPEIANELGARHILEGSVRREGNKVRIIVQLIDADRDEHLWAETYDRELNDIFAVQSEVAREISSSLKVALDVDTLERIRTAPTQNMDAYELYLQGRSLVLGGSPQSVQQGMAVLQQALVLDPDFALAQAWIAGVYVSMAELGAVEWQTVRPVALQAAEKAIQLAPDEAESNSILGGIYFMDRKMSLAEKHLARALELDPNSVLTLTMKSNVSMMTGNLEEAYQLRRRAVALDPLDARANLLLAFSLEYLGRHDEGVRHVEKALSLEPGGFTYIWASNFYAMAVDPLNQMRVLLAGYREEPGNIRYPLDIAVKLFWLGDPQSSEFWLDTATAISPNHEGLLQQKTDWLNAQGRFEEAERHIDGWLVHNPDSPTGKRYKARALQIRADIARADEGYELARQLDEQSLQMASEFVDRYRVDANIRPDVMNAWGLLTLAGSARRAENEPLFEEARQSLVDLYAGAPGIFWADYHLAVVHAMAGERETALEYMQKVPDSPFDGVWILDFLEMYSLEGFHGDLGYLSAKDKLKARNDANLELLRRELPELFDPSLLQTK